MVSGCSAMWHPCPGGFALMHIDDWKLKGVGIGKTSVIFSHGCCVECCHKRLQCLFRCWVQPVQHYRVEVHLLMTSGCWWHHGCEVIMVTSAEAVAPQWIAMHYPFASIGGKWNRTAIFLYFHSEMLASAQITGEIFRIIIPITLSIFHQLECECCTVGTASYSRHVAKLKLKLLLAQLHSSSCP